MVSTLEAFFSGRRELFNGLYIETVEWDWQQYPIMHLDLNVEKYTTPEALYNILDAHLCVWENVYGKEDYEKSFGARFMGVMRRAFEQTGRQVVVQIEEKQYAKPFEGDGRTIYKIGVSFSSKTRRMTEWKIA